MIHITETSVRRLFLLVAFAIFFIAALAGVKEAYALGVSPVRLELSGDPGQVVRGEMTLINSAGDTSLYHATYENFEAKGESGTPNFVESKEGLAGWIRTQASVDFGSQGRGTQVKVPYEIAIPSDARPGGYFAAVFWSNQPPESAGSVSIGAKVGVLILLRVNGDIEEGGGIIEYGITDDEKFYTELPVDFYYRFQNDGADRLKPEGVIKIKNTFGGTAEELDANEARGNVLPTTVRRFGASWGLSNTTAIESLNEDEKLSFFRRVGHQLRNFKLGRYTAIIDLTFAGDDDPARVSTDKVSFFIFPWQALLTLFIALMLFIIIVRRTLRAYNRMIIKQAARHFSSTGGYDDGQNSSISPAPSKPISKGSNSHSSPRKLVR